MGRTAKARELSKMMDRWTTSAFYNGRHWARVDADLARVAAGFVMWDRLVRTEDEREALSALLPATWAAWWRRGFEAEIAGAVSKVAVGPQAPADATEGAPNGV